MIRPRSLIGSASRIGGYKLSGYYGTFVGTVCVLLVSAYIGALVCKVVHESGHALTAIAFGSRVESVGVRFPLKPGFFRIAYSLPGEQWQKGLTTLMGTGATTILAYMLVFIMLGCRCPVRFRLAVLLVALVCAWDMFLYSVLPLLGLRRFLLFGGRHAEPVSGAQMIGIPTWLFLCGLAVSFMAFHALLYCALRRHL